MPEPDLAEKVASWLASEGFKLEYQTVAAFQRSGLDALPAYYVASAEGKLREMDAAAWREQPAGFVSVLCECKYSADHPWVVLATDGHLDPFSQWLHTPKGTHLTHSEMGGWLGPAIEKCWHFSRQHRIAVSITQALRRPKKGEADGSKPQPGNSRDVAFDALQKITNAAWDHARAHGQAVSFPCLVVEGPLFVAEFDPQALRFVVNRSRMLRMRWLGCESGTMVDVVQASALPDHANHVKHTFETIGPVLDRIAEEKSRRPLMIG